MYRQRGADTFLPFKSGGKFTKFGSGVTSTPFTITADSEIKTVYIAWANYIDALYLHQTIIDVTNEACYLDTYQISGTFSDLVSVSADGKTVATKSSSLFAGQTGWSVMYAVSVDG